MKISLNPKPYKRKPRRKERGTERKWKNITRRKEGEERTTKQPNKKRQRGEAMNQKKRENKETTKQERRERREIQVVLASFPNWDRKKPLEKKTC